MLLRIIHLKFSMYACECVREIVGVVKKKTAKKKEINVSFFDSGVLRLLFPLFRFVESFITGKSRLSAFSPVSLY